jgi:hypothetical protein
MAAIDQLELLAGRKAADRPSAAAPTAAADDDEDDLPIPSDINTVLLGGLFVLAMLAACYVAPEILLPIVLAFVLSLVLTPGDEGAPAGASPAGACGHAHHPGAVCHARRAGGNAFGPGNQLGAEAAHWDS